MFVSFAHLLRTGRRVSVSASEGGMLFSQDGKSVPPPIRFTPSELDEMARDYFLWGAEISRGEVIVDAGVGMGTELLTYTGVVGEAGLVIGFEAHPKSFAIAKKLVDLNELANVNLHQNALWSSACKIILSDSPTSLGINSAVDRRLLEEQTVDVDAVTLDSWFAGSKLAEIGLLKMNIEGAEIEALKGARRMLSYTNRVVVACHDFVNRLEGGGSEMNTKAEVRSILEDAGFRIKERLSHKNPAIRDTLYGTKE